MYHRNQKSRRILWVWQRSSSFENYNNCSESFLKLIKYEGYEQFENSFNAQRCKDYKVGIKPSSLKLLTLSNVLLLLMLPNREVLFISILPTQKSDILYGRSLILTFGSIAFWVASVNSLRKYFFGEFAFSTNLDWASSLMLPKV